MVQPKPEFITGLRTGTEIQIFPMFLNNTRKAFSKIQFTVKFWYIQAMVGNNFQYL
jgi:hypothetical protein